MMNRWKPSEGTWKHTGKSKTRCKSTALIAPEATYTLGDITEDVVQNVIEHFTSGTPLNEMITPEFNMKVQAALDAGIRSCESGCIEDVAEPFYDL